MATEPYAHIEASFDVVGERVDRRPGLAAGESAIK
jgi:hypothetical protein